MTAESILNANRQEILGRISAALEAIPDLVRLAGRWFSRSLMLEVNQGHLNLAEAVLDMLGGGPLTTAQVLEQIGGLGGGSDLLQEFCLAYAMSRDERFDEVGPLDTVLWFLRRSEPDAVQQTPTWLRFSPTPFDSASLTPEQRALEAEIDDEWSDLPPGPDDQEVDHVRVILSYPHRRAGTLPLSARMRGIFPTARSSARIAFMLIDAQSGEEHSGWVVRNDRYVVGAGPLFEKHKLPVGTLLTVHREKNTDRVIVDFAAHRPRTEWVRVLVARNGQLGFEDQKRPIGAEYDELMIVGADDLAFIDGQAHNMQRRSLAALLKILIAELSRGMPQGAVHAKTLYSALNFLRRCPPGPMLAALNADPDFFYVGNHYWQIGSP